VRAGLFSGLAVRAMFRPVFAVTGVFPLAAVLSESKDTHRQNKNPANITNV